MYFKSLFASTNGATSTILPRLRHVMVPCLDGEAVQALTHPITMAEVATTLNHMNSFKAPGPGEFQAIFVKQYWHLIGNGISILVTQTAFTIGTFDDKIAETLVVLIPKVDNPRNFKELRPISLCNTFYKLITKVIVNRLRPFLEKIIGPYQSNFLPGRGTYDNAIVLHEVFHSMRKSSKKKEM